MGRTGAMTAAHLVDMRAATPQEALRRNVAVGPPSLEQIWFVARLGHGIGQPPLAVKIVSRILDAPRRIWSRVRHARRSTRRSISGRSVAPLHAILERLVAVSSRHHHYLNDP